MPKTTKAFESYDHLEQMEGYRTTGYIVSGTDSSGITIGFGIDLSQPPYNTAEGLKKAGFSKEFIDNVVSLDILGKDVGTLKGEGKDPSKLAKKVTLPNDEETKQKQFEIVKNSLTARTKKYQNTMDVASQESYATLSHWGGTPMSKSDRDKVKDPNKLGPYDRKAYVFGVIQDTIDDVIEKNGSINNEQYQAAILNGRNSISNFKELSPLNTQTLNREIAFVADSSGTSVTNRNYVEVLEKSEVSPVATIDPKTSLRKPMESPFDNEAAEKKFQDWANKQGYDTKGYGWGPASQKIYDEHKEEYDKWTAEEALKPTPIPPDKKPVIKDLPSKEEFEKEKLKEEEKVIEEEVIKDPDDKITIPTFKEIQDSVARGERSRWNRGPDGEMLPEGYTMDSLGKVVWVGEGPEPISEEEKVIEEEVEKEVVEEEVVEDETEQERIAREEEMRKQSEIESQRLMQEEREKEEAYHAEQAKIKQEQDKKIQETTIPVPTEEEILQNKADEQQINQIQENQDEEDVDNSGLIDTEEAAEEEVIEELVKPRLKDYDNSLDYMNDRMEYFKKLEEKEQDAVEEKDEVIDAGKLPEVKIEEKKEKVETKEVKVLDIDGNVKTISTPVVPEEEVIEEEVIEEEVVEEEVVEEEVVEEDKEVLEGSRNIFNLSEGETIFDFIIGEVEDVLKVTPKVSKSIIAEDVVTEDVVTEDVVTEDVVTEDVVTEDVVTEDVIKGLTDTTPKEVPVVEGEDVLDISAIPPPPMGLDRGVFAPLSPGDKYEGVDRERLSILLHDAIMKQDKVLEEELVKAGALMPSDLKKIKEKEKKQKEKEEQVKSGDLYNQNALIIEKSEETINKNTINTLAIQNPDILNIDENGVVTDNDNNIIQSKKDWLGLGVLGGNTIYDAAKTQSTSGKTKSYIEDLRRKQERMDGAWEYLNSSVSNETGQFFSDMFFQGHAETINWGDFENEIKREALNMIPRDKITSLYNEYTKEQLKRGVRGKPLLKALPFVETMSLAEKENILMHARLKVYNDQQVLMEQAFGKLKVEGGAYDNAFADYSSQLTGWQNYADNTQEQLNNLKLKHGRYTYDRAGNRIYVPNIDTKLWPDKDKASINNINNALVDLESQRLDLNKLGNRVQSQREAYNNNAKKLVARQEDLFAVMMYDSIDGKFLDAFKQSRINKLWEESIETGASGRFGDVIATTVEEFARLKALRVGITKASARFVGTYALLPALVADLTSPLWANKVYTHNPLSINDFNKGESHVGMIFDMMLGVATTDFIPDSNKLEGRVINPDYKPTFKSDSPVLEWTGQLYQTVAPKWAGGHGNYNAYSTSKSFAQLLPYTVNIMSAYRNVGTQSTKAKTLWDGRTKLAKKYKVNDGFGKKIINSLNKDFVASERMMGTLNMIRVNHKMTLFDNIADGRARGLSRSDAFTYGNALSLATGLSQSVMPDYMWLNTTIGKNLANTLASSLKTPVGKTATEMGKAFANKAALTQFGKNFMKEHLEEQLDVFLQDVVKSVYIADHSLDIKNVHMQAEVLSGTTILTLPIGGVGAVRTRNNVRQRVYKEFRKNATGIIKSGLDEIRILEDKISSLTNSKVDVENRKMLESEVALLKQNVSDAKDFRRTMNAAPEYATDTQLDYLLQKQKLLDKRKELNTQDKAINSEEIEKINTELEKLDEGIQTNSFKNYKETLYKKLLENSIKLAKKLGVTIEHTPLSEEDYAKAVELENRSREEHNKGIDEEITKLRKNKKKGYKRKILNLEKKKLNENISLEGPGHITYVDARDENGKLIKGVVGKHVITINEGAAKYQGNHGVVLHELLHAVLRNTVLNNPDSIKGLSHLLMTDMRNNPEKYQDVERYVTWTDEVTGKFDQYKFDKEMNNLQPDEIFNVFSEALAQGNIKVDVGLIGKVNDIIRRLFRKIGVNFKIKDPDDMVNFIRDYNNEVMSGRNNFSLGMQKVARKGLPIQISGKAIKDAKEYEQRMMLAHGLDYWWPEYSKGAMSIKYRTRTNIYRDNKIEKDLQLGERTKAIVAENERLRGLILAEGLRDGEKIVASADLQNQLVENNLPMAVSLANFAAKNPKIMGLEAGKRVTRDQFLSGYYLQLNNLARTYDASVAEFGQYLNTILPLRYGEILEAEKKGAVEGTVSIDEIGDIEDDITGYPTPVDVGPKTDVAERLGVKEETQPIVDKTLKQIRRLRALQEKLAEKQDSKLEEKIAKISADLESKGQLDLDVEALTVKQAPNMLYKTVSKLFGIDEDKLNPNSESWMANLRKTEGKRGSNEVRAAQRAVLKHIQVIMSTVFNEGHTAAFKSSGMPNVLLKFGYNKSSKRIGNNYPQYKKPNLTEEDLLNFVGIERQTIDGRKVFKFNVDRNTGTKLLAIASVADRAMSLEAINKSLEDSGDMTAKIRNSIEDGLANYKSKSIYYIQSDASIQEAIDEKLPEIGFKLQNVDENWTLKEMKKEVIKIFKDIKIVNGSKFAADLFKKTGIVTRYNLMIVNLGKVGEKPLITFEEYAKQELGELQVYKGLFAMLGIKAENKQELYTRRNLRRARKRVADFAVMIEEKFEEEKNKIKSPTTKEGKKKLLKLKKEAMELLFMLEQQHITATKMGDNKWQAIAGTNTLVLKGKPERQRDQFFGSKKGAAMDYRLFVNSRLTNLQMPLTVKEANAIKKTLGIKTLSAQKSKAVIKEIIKGTFNFKGRKNEAMIARELVKLEVQFYGKLYKDGKMTREEFAMHMLTFGSNMSTASRRAAFVYGMQEGTMKDGKYIYGKENNIGKDLEYEHGKPHEQLILELTNTILTEKERKWSDMMDETFIDYEVNIITKKMDDTLTATGRKSRMGAKYVKGLLQGWTQRLYNEENLGHPDVGVIISLDGKNTKHGDGHSKASKVLPKSVGDINVDKKISKGIQKARSIKYNQETRGMSAWDLDDTLARTKSGVRYTIPNPDMTPQPGRKVIFMAGGPGSGKSTVIKGLGLKEQGFKIVNQDISLEWLMKNHGLPTDMKDFTPEQASTFGKLGWEARMIAKRKQAKYQGKGDGIIVDGTGNSLKTMQNHVREFKNKGYDVQMVFVETSLETALERNRARKERSLRDGIVKRTHESVQNNKKAFQELFGNNFTEIKTDKLKQGDPMPPEAINQVNEFTKSYIKGRLSAEEFATKGADILERGGEFDFVEFDIIKEGEQGPLFNKAMESAKKFGLKDQYILTARPHAAKIAIFRFLDAQGLKIPFDNIITLENSTPEAKALWIAEKIGEGYNDIYFADDALQNVEAVEDMMNQFDVKGKVQQAKSKSINYDNEFNEILEESKGIGADKRFSKAKARKRGEDKGVYQIFIPPSAEDFVGMIYYFLGKGKQGEKHMKWFKEKLLVPLNRAYRELNDARQAISNDYQNLQKKFPNIKKKLYKKLPGTEFTHQDAIRVYLWNKFGHRIAGLSQTDELQLAAAIANDSELKAYADTLSVISRDVDGYIAPTDHWMVEDIRVDLMNATSTINRKTFFQEFIENSKIIFSEENLNKIEAIYGKNFREALEDMLYRTITGTNRSFGGNRIVNRFMNWINGSIGTTMFFNSRSAVLQTLSTVNFINWGDNNLVNAAKAFANQKQFWGDFALIFNSNFLRQRRAGLSMDINANELANYVSESRSPFKAALNWLLTKGFLPTQIVDSFAIAAGGATFYRNRVNTYIKQGDTIDLAQEKAFIDMQEIAEETQQSARPDRISQQQASVLGRVILAFQNTPMQYMRLTKKALLDLMAGRGDAKTHISKIVYYGMVQNLLFYSLQTALFAMMFGDDDDEEFFDKKKERVLNGSLDSILRGMGIGGAVISTLKNMILKFAQQQKLPKWKKDESAVLMEMLNLSPPIGIKARQLVSAQKTINWNKDTIKEMPYYDLSNPLWEAGFLTTQSLTNIPLARLHTKTTNIRESLNKENEAWQRIAMFLGWSKWNLGVKEKRRKTKKRKGKKRLYVPI